MIPGRTWILLYLGRTVYKRLWACLALYKQQLTLQMWACYRIAIVLLETSLYCSFWDAYKIVKFLCFRNTNSGKPQLADEMTQLDVLHYFQRILNKGSLTSNPPIHIYIDSLAQKMWNSSSLCEIETPRQTWCRTKVVQKLTNGEELLETNSLIQSGMEFVSWTKLRTVVHFKAHWCPWPWCPCQGGFFVACVLLLTYF